MLVICASRVCFAHYQRSCLVLVKGCILDVGSILQSPNQLYIFIYSYRLDYKSRLNVYIYISRVSLA